MSCALSRRASSFGTGHAAPVFPVGSANRAILPAIWRDPLLRCRRFACDFAIDRTLATSSSWCSGCCWHHSSASIGAAPTADFGGIVSERPGGGIARMNCGSAVSHPIVRLQFSHANMNAEVVQSIVRVMGSMQWLGLKQRVVSVERDGRVGPCQPDIREKRPEPTIRFNDTFEEIVTGARQVGGRAQQQAPIGRCAGE